VDVKIIEAVGEIFEQPQEQPQDTGYRPRIQAVVVILP